MHPAHATQSTHSNQTTQITQTGCASFSAGTSTRPPAGPAPQQQRSRLALAAVLGTALFCAACGGGGDDGATAAPDPDPVGGGGAVSLSCDKTLFVPTAVLAVPTAAELTTLAGTYRGDEGTYTMTGFERSGSATLVLGSDGKVTYNTAAQTVKSACIETVSGSTTQLLYLHFTQGHVDLWTDGRMSGVSPADPSLAFTGTKG